MGRVHSGVGYLTGREFAVDSSTKRILQRIGRKFKLIPRIKNDP